MQRHLSIRVDFEVGGGRPFLENRNQKGGSFRRASLAVVWAFLVVIPMVVKNFTGSYPERSSRPAARERCKAKFQWRYLVRPAPVALLAALQSCKLNVTFRQHLQPNQKSSCFFSS